MAAVALLGTLAGATAPASAASAVDLTRALAGPWELAIPKSSRSCRLTLGAEAAPGGHVVGAPPACRIALPLLVQVSAWTVNEDKSISLVDAAGKSVVDFKPTAQAGHFAAKAGADSFTLAPATGPKDADRTGSIAAALSGKAPPAGAQVAAAATAPAAAAPAELAPIRPEAVVGLYGVAREKNKPICSIDLTNRPLRKAGVFVASLSGGCIDPGLKVFDPVGWRVEKGRLFLIAKKGHEQGFAPGPDGVFSKDPPSGAQLFLRKQ
ncbi:MAG: AprI/Inh family metalloprotease inhibitor [Alsobacter sp.]